MKIINHVRLWSEWRKKNLNGKFYKFLVLLKIVKSPTFEVTNVNSKYKNMWERIFDDRQ